VLNPGELQGADRELHECALRGEELDLRGRPDDERHVPAEVIYWLCVVASGLHAKGVRLRGARVDGSLDFESARLKVPLMLTDCVIGDPDEPDTAAVILEQSSGPWISFDRCHINGRVSAPQLRVANDVSLSSATITGPVGLAGGGHRR
jgi:hypothetical protein